jgi:HD-like signal output (HDOD) protein
MTVTEAQVVASLSALPAFPQVLPEVQRIVADERCTVAQLEAVIAPDAAITVNVLALVNSAAFALPRRVESVRQALSLLGTRRVVDVVTAAAYSRVLPDELPGYRIGAAEFWTHCSAVAVLATQVQRALPTEARRESGGDLFTAGLLHDLGKLAIATFLEDNVDQALVALRGGQQDFFGAEREALGTDHALVGELLARRWNLPTLVEIVARWHHAPSAAPAEHQVAVSVVHLANALAHGLGLGADAGELAREVDLAAIDALGLQGEQIEGLCADALEEVERLSDALGGKESAR